MRAHTSIAFKAAECRGCGYHVRARLWPFVLRHVVHHDLLHARDVTPDEVHASHTAVHPVNALLRPTRCSREARMLNCSR